MVYTTKEAAKILSVTPRTIVNYCKIWNVPLFKNQYQITDEHLAEFKAQVYATPPEPKKEEEGKEKKLREAISLLSEEAQKRGLTYKLFTDEELEDIISNSTTIEHQAKQIEMHQEQIQYLRKRIEKQDEVLGNLSRYLEQRNFIEAKEKRYDSE